MKLPFYKQFIIIALMLGITFNADLSRFAQAADEAVDTTGVAAENEDTTNQDVINAQPSFPEFDEINYSDDAPEFTDFGDEQAAAPASMGALQALSDATKDISDDTDAIFNLSSALGLDNNGVSRITMPSSDLDKIKNIYYMAKVLPDYENDYTSLYRDLPAPSRAEVDKALTAEAAKTTPLFNSPEMYFSYLKDGGDTVAASDMVGNIDIFNKLVLSAEERLDSQKIRQIWTQLATDIGVGKEITADPAIIARIAGLTVANVTATLQGGTPDDKAVISAKITSFLSTSMIDIRIVKTLVYLVTPKSQGGAGHWKITVSRIFQNSDNSSESQPTKATLTTNTTNTTTTCPETATAAECGYLQTSRATAEVEDANGQQYEAYIQDLAKQEDVTLTNTATAAEVDAAKKPTSVHAGGQAIDISEIDDIRCTVIQKKRIGSDKISAKPIQPIKLAWQTSEGYAASGGNQGDDVMSTMKAIASDSVKELLTSFNGDLNYDGDLSRASFDDILMILGKSMVGYAISGNGQVALKGFDTKETLKNLGGMYLADYMGLPREIFTGTNAIDSANPLKDIENIKYLIGRTAIEQRLGLAYGSLDSSITVNGETKNNLEGLVTNIGRTKLEHEMGLVQGALKDVNTDVPIDVAIGQSIIEQELNLKAGTWPSTSIGWSALKGVLPILRTQIMKSDPGYIDGLLHLANGTTQALINGKLTENGATTSFDAWDYAKKVGKVRMDDTITGLKYFASYNDAYQLPQGTWEKAIAMDTEAFKTIGVYTLARLLGDDSLAPDTINKLPAGVTAASVTWEEGGLPYTYTSMQGLGSSDFGRFGFRTWLRENLNPAKTQDQACKSNHTGLDINVAVTNNAGRTFAQSMDIIKAQLCPLDVVIPYSLNYREGLADKSVATDTIVDIPQTKATAIGLDSLDLYRIMGYYDANGNDVFKRIGSKILYYALANKALSGDDKLKIDLKDINPVVKTDNKEINFYIDHIFRGIDLAKKIKTDWEIVKKDSSQAKVIADKIDEIVARLGTTFTDGESDASKFQKIALIAKDVTLLVDDLKTQIVQLKTYYETLRDVDSQKKVQQINAMIIDINELIRCLAEMIAGKEIKQVDDLQINQIQLTLDTKSTVTDNSAERRNSKKISPWKLTSLLFGFLAGKTNLSDTFIAIGSGVAEANLGLPANSLLYLVQNYEERGLQTVEGFYEAIGQARIEEQFNMPAFYFQGFSLDSKMPKFNVNNKLLKQWLPDSVPAGSGSRNYTAVKKLTDQQFDQFITQLLFPELVINQYGSLVPKQITGSPMPSANYNNMIWDAEANWQKIRAQDLAANGRNTMGEKTLSDVIRNIDERGYGDGLRTAEEDLSFRMGYPTNAYTSMTSGTSSDLGKYSSTSTTIDNVFNIPKGSTQSLFTGENSLYSTSLTNKEKNLIEASTLNLGTNFVEKYIQLINGEILPGEMDMYAYGQKADYISINPYAKTPDTADTCPVIYTDNGSFQVNNSDTYLANDSFCYYDQKGRHCFQSADEAQRFANENEVDSLKHMRLEDTNGDGKIDEKDEEIGNDILGYIAMKLTIAYNVALQAPGAGLDAFGRPATDGAGNNNGASLRLGYSEIYFGLTKFVNDKKMKTIFDDIKVDGKQMNSGVAFGLIAQTSDLPTEILTKLFSRTTIDAPVANYKRIVGREEAQKIITGKMFDFVSSRDLGVGPFEAKMFDAGDFYDILHGDYSSVVRVGAKLVDDQMEFKPGTTALIAAAGSLSTLTCAMAQAGGQYFGKLFGLSNLPLNGISGTKDFIDTIGETKIEEALGLPTGSFRGNSIDSVINNVGAISFAVAFKIPQKNGITYNDIVPILGESKASAIKNSSDLDKLKAVQRFLVNSPVISNVANAGMRTLEAKIKDNTSYVMNKFASANPADLQNSIGPNSSKDEITWHNDVAAFVYLLWNLDAGFSIDGGSSFRLFSKQLTTNAYTRLVADKVIQRAGAMGLGNALGLDASESEGAANLLINFQIIFFCSSPNDDPHGKSHQITSSGTCIIHSENDSGFGWTTDTKDAEPMYHNWGYVYSNLDKIFNFKLDERAKVPQGTFAQMIREPQNAARIALKVATGKLDQKFELDPNAISSFSGLFRYLFPDEIAAAQTPEDRSADILLAQGHANIDDAISAKKAELAGYQDSYNSLFAHLVPLADKLMIDKSLEGQLLMGIENILMSQDDIPAKNEAFMNNALANIPDLNKDATRWQIFKEMSDMFEMLIPVAIPVSKAQRELAVLESQKKDIENQIAAKNAQKTADVVTARNAKATELDKKADGIPEGIARVFDRVWAWAKDAAAEQIHNKILDVKWNGQKIGIDMPMEDVRMIFRDIRYISIAGMAMSANLVQIQIDRIGTNNCNPKEISDGKCPTAVPSGFRLTYADFHASLFGIREVDVNKLSAYAYVTGNVANPATTPYNSSNITCPDSGSGQFSAGVDCLGQVTPGYQNTTLSIQKQTEKNYDYSPTNYAATLAEQQGIIDQARFSAEEYCLTKTTKENPAYQSCYEEYMNVDPAYQQAINNVDILNNPANHTGEIAVTKNTILGQAKKSAWENLQYKLMDIGLWKLDDNVFPGFSNILMNGSPDARVAGFAKYFENGLTNGHLFGIKFDRLSGAELLIANFAMQFLDHKFINPDKNALQNSFLDFAGGPGLSAMTDWVVKNSKDWFGFKLPPDIFKGLMVGLCTGKWGLTDVSLDQVTGSSSAQTTDVGRGIKLPTLGAALVSFGSNWVFNWADKTFKWKVGTALTIFLKSYELYKNIKLISDLQSIKTLKDLADASGATKAAVAAAAGVKDVGEIKDAKALDDATAAAEAAAALIILRLIVYFVSPAIQRTIYAVWGDDIRQFEADNGLVPGSLDILINAVIDLVVAILLVALVWALTATAILGPETGAIIMGAALLLVSILLNALLFVAIPLFILSNLFGVYEVDIYCTADGYYPYIDSARSTRHSGFLGVNHQYNQTYPPSYVTKDNDISGLGIWGGKINGRQEEVTKIMQNNSIAAAQYKAKTLIGDLLNLQKFTKYNDSSNEPTVPIQIMTGRQVDVDYWSSTIGTNMCQARLGKEYTSVNGICGRVNARGEMTSTTRMGVWKNLQNVAFTHIGF